MPKIAFVGAGSAVFTRNLVGDILSLPELRDSAEFALMDIDAERLETAELVTSRLIDAHGASATRRVDDGPARGAGRRRLRRHLVPGRRLQAVDRGRLRGPQALRAAPDDRRHARHRRDHARTAHDPGAAGRLPRPRGALARRAGAQLRQPDGDALLGGERGVADPDRRALPLRAGHDQGAGGTTSGSRPARSTSSRPASTTWRSSCASSTRAEDLYPALRELEPPELNRVRYEVLKHFGYFVTESSEHFSEYVPWFIKDGRGDLIERFNVPLDEYPRRCERQIARVGVDQRRRARGLHRAVARVRRAHHQRVRDG